MGEIKESKVAIVTGAASGIGAALTRHLIDTNHLVLGVDINSSKLNALRDDTGCATIVGDIASEEFNQSVAGHANEIFGRLDYVFLNAGILGRDIELQGTEFKIDDLEQAKYTRQDPLISTHSLWNNSNQFLSRKWWWWIHCSDILNSRTYRLESRPLLYGYKTCSYRMGSRNCTRTPIPNDLYKRNMPRGSSDTSRRVRAS